MPKFNSHTAKASLQQLGKDAKRPLSIIAGLFAATQMANFLNRNISPAVSGIFGLDGIEAKKIVTPVLLATAGIAGQQFVKNEITKDVLTGVAIGGGIVLVNEIAQKKIISLSGVDDDEQILLPGIGEAPTRALPGIGEPELPSLEDFAGVDGDEDENFEDAEVMSGVEDENFEDAEVMSGVDEEMFLQ